MRPARSKAPPRTPGGPGAVSRIQRMNSKAETEEVAVFCRVRPLPPSNGSDAADADLERCVEVVDESSLRLIPPESSRAFYNGKTSEHSFKYIFDEDSTQKEVFQRCGLPLVKELLNGKNGLLFTYGVTGSGKTYTMQGTPANGGIMTRAIDVIFNSLEDRLTSRKFLIDSDKLNDFQVQSVAEAALRQQKEMVNDLKSNRTYATRNNTSDPNLSGRLPDETKLEDIDQNCVYAVFISYCEIYNKYIYDLLDDTRDPVTGRFKFESKNLREDAHGNMFVYGSTEKEVRSPKEALELFYKGQKKRRVAQTQLNFESSRSHSVFNIRLVKCHPSDRDEVDSSKACLVSQLALVDLAGSERTSRTGNTGERLREAGNINQSLMALRACIERLRENQKSNSKSGNVPYRNDKITHLFRNYFGGVGSVKMIVNINPRASDYEETVNVLQFAEMTQEVEIERFDPILRDIAATPSRHRAQLAYEEALNRQQTDVDVDKLNVPFCPIYSLGPAYPSMDWQGFDDEETIPSLLRHLEQKNATRNTLVQDYKSQQEQFRQRLVELEKNAILLSEENKRLKSGWEGEKRRTRDLETRLVNAEAANNSLQRRAGAAAEQKVVLEQELDEKEIELNQQRKDSKRQVRRLRSQISCNNEEPAQYNLRRTSSKRSYEQATAANDENNEETQYKDVGARIAEWRNKLATQSTKKIRM